MVAIYPNSNIVTPHLLRGLKCGYRDKHGMTVVKYFLFTSLLVSLIAGEAHAGAWVQDVDKGLFIQNFSYYSADKFYNNSGDKQSMRTYRKYELNPYIEYGLSNRLTVGANIFLDRASQYDTISSRNRTNLGIGDSEFFARSQIWKKDGLVFSAEPMIKLPSPDSRSDSPQIGSDKFDAQISFSGGYGFKAWELDHFIDISTGYRHRFGAPHDQFKFSATAGFSATKQIVITTQLFSTLRADKSASPAFTQSSIDDYDLTKLQISAAYKIDDKLSLQLGVFDHIHGRNVGSGGGTILSVNKAF